MKIKFEKNNNQIILSWRERIILFCKGKVVLDDIAVRHLGNHLMKMHIDWLETQPESIRSMQTTEETEIKTK